MKLDKVASGLNFNELHQHIPGQGWSKIKLTDGQIKKDGSVTFDASAGGSFVFLEVFDRAQQTGEFLLYKYKFLCSLAVLSP